MAGLFSQAQMDQINAIAAKSKTVLKPVKSSGSISSKQKQIDESTREVLEYFKDSPAILITSREQLHTYVLNAIESGYCGIDTETTGLDRIHDTIVGVSLYYPGGVECYIPSKHKTIVDTYYKDQLSYEDIGAELQLFVENKTKLIFANADFDLAMIYKDLHVDLVDVCYYDVISAWRCLKEDEPDNALKVLYWKYPNNKQGSPKKFSDFFSPALFPYSNPNVAKLYAANDAKITYELFVWQLPYVTKSHPKCQKHHLEKVADLLWNLEIPLIRICALMHRFGIYFDSTTNAALQPKYDRKYHAELETLSTMVQEIINTTDAVTMAKSPFKSGKEFNANSSQHVLYLLNSLLNFNVESGKKDVLDALDTPITNQILKVRTFGKLLKDFVISLSDKVGSDSRVHSTFKSLGTDTGRMCIAKGTKITCLNDTKNIEDIVPGDLVYCYDDNGTLQLKPVKHLWLTGTNRECVRVKWQSSDSGDIGELICTPEHRILKKSGEWCRADQLSHYDKLAHLRRTIPENGQGRPRLFGWNDLCIQEQLVVKYSIFNADDKDIIHHIDGDKTNNALENLTIMSQSEHTSYHSKEFQRLGVINASSMLTEEAIQHRVQVQAEKFKNRCVAEREELLSLIKQYNGRLTKIPIDFECFKRRCKLAGIDVYAECAKYSSHYASYMISEDVFLDSYRRCNGNKSKISKDLGISYQTCRTLCNKYAYPLNHMVQSVTYAGTYDVYDIEVEDIHNFIANEICVHNSCADPNVQQIPSHATDIRHQFRATPAMLKVDDCKIVADTVQVTLGMWDTVWTADGSPIKVNALKVGDQIKLLKDKKEVIAVVKSVSNQAPDTCICFTV